MTNGSNINVIYVFNIKYLLEPKCTNKQNKPIFKQLTCTSEVDILTGVISMCTHTPKDSTSPLEVPGMGGTGEVLSDFTLFAPSPGLFTSLDGLVDKPTVALNDTGLRK